jgi:hypothetical protein
MEFTCGFALIRLKKDRNFFRMSNFEKITLDLGEKSVFRLIFPRAAFKTNRV